MSSDDDRTFGDPSEILARIFDMELADVHVCKLGKVTSYNATTQRADVQPLYKAIVNDDLGERTETPAVLSNVPVVRWGCGAISISLPIAKGDFVLLVFADHSLDRVATSKDGMVDPVATRDPGAARNHHLSDAIAIPIAGSKALGATTSPTIEIKRTGVVEIGGTAPVALQSALQTLADHVATLPVGGAGSAPIPSPSMGTGTDKLRG